MQFLHGDGHNGVMKIRQIIPPLLVAVAFLLQLSAGSAQAGHYLSPYSPQTTPRPTIPKPTKAPTKAPTQSNRGGHLPTQILIPTRPGPTATPSITPTPTQTMDLSLNTFLANSYAKGTPTNTATPLIDQAPSQNAITATFAATYSASLRTITPMPGMYQAVTKGVIIPFVIVVFVLTGIISVRGFLRKRF